MKLQKNVLLALHTSFNIGGPAKYFVEAKEEKDIVKAVEFAKQEKLPFFVLSGGSNVLAPDKGFEGVVIKCQMPDVKCKDCMIRAESGVELEKIVDLAAENSLTGLEWAAGIPGKVGGAVWGNAQAFGKNISGTIEQVEVFDAKNLKAKKLNKKDCSYSEKDSLFKRNKDLIILEAVFKLKKGDKKEIKRIIEKNIDFRKQKHPLEYGSAGSVFINQLGCPPSSLLIEEAGLKGKRVGWAAVSKKHAGFIINLGGAKAEDVLKLIELIKKEVEKKFNINLKEEIQIIL